MERLKINRVEHRLYGILLEHPDYSVRRIQYLYWIQYGKWLGIRYVKYVMEEFENDRTAFQIQSVGMEYPSEFKRRVPTVSIVITLAIVTILAIIFLK